MLGDPTEKAIVRATFNPLRHVNPFGTVILSEILVFTGVPFLFGWAKPGSVDMIRLRNPRRDMALDAAAGPLTNLALAWASAVAAHLLFLLPNEAAIWVAEYLERSLQINLIFAVLNILPPQSLDRGRVAVGILPDPLASPLARLEKFGLFILIAVLFIVPMITQRLGIEFDLVGLLIREPAIWLKIELFAVTGIQ